MAIILKGRVFNRKCQPISNARVEVWHAGKAGEKVPGNANYTFPPDKLWYRGRTSTNQDGEYEFNTTYPAIYKSRAIPHIHYKVPKLH